MGTRNLTIVKHKGNYVVAQYCQWDGYPSGQGLTVLEFVRDKMKPRKFIAGLKAIVPVTDKIVEEAWKSVGATSNWVDLDISDKFEKTFPSLHRNTGAKILEMIQNEKGVLIKTDLEFWDDSLFCEWAYVVDLDAKTLSVYTSGKTLVKEWAFNELPSNKEFCDSL